MSPGGAWGRRAAGLGLILLGLFLVGGQLLWRSETAPGIARVPLPVGNALVFLIGLLGLLLIWVGFSLLRRGAGRRGGA